VVYIKEAHPEDGWQVPQNQRDGVVFNDPKTADERGEVAKTCALKLSLKMPFVVDEMDNPVEAAYAAWPDRLYIVDKEGKIAYKGGPGPRGFNAQAMAEKLADLLKSQSPGQK